MGGSSVFKAPIKIAQRAGIMKKATPAAAPKPVVTPVVSPTVAEVSQSEAANASVIHKGYVTKNRISARY